MDICDRQGLKQSQRWLLTFFNTELEFAYNVESVKSNLTFWIDLHGNSLYLLFVLCKKKKKNHPEMWWVTSCSVDGAKNSCSCTGCDELIWENGYSTKLRITGLDKKAYWIRLSTCNIANNGERLLPDVPLHRTCISREFWVNSPQLEGIGRNALHIYSHGWLLVKENPNVIWVHISN